MNSSCLNSDAEKKEAKKIDSRLVHEWSDRSSTLGVLKIDVRLDCLRLL
jgi:hypothetical protein